MKRYLNNLKRDLASRWMLFKIKRYVKEHRRRQAEAWRAAEEAPRQRYVHTSQPPVGGTAVAKSATPPMGQSGLMVRGEIVETARNSWVEPGRQIIVDLGEGR